MSDNDGQTLLLFLAGAWLLREALAGDLAIQQRAQQGGVDLWEDLHGDQKHKKDLPGKAWSMSQIEAVARGVGFPDPHVAAAIAMAESGGVPNAKGDYRDSPLGGTFLSHGLWQINVRAHPKYVPEKMYQPRLCAQAAYEISNGGKDWSAWSTWWADANTRTGPGQGRFRRFL